MSTRIRCYANKKRYELPLTLANVRIKARVEHFGIGQMQ